MRFILVSPSFWVRLRTESGRARPPEQKQIPQRLHRSQHPRGMMRSDKLSRGCRPGKAPQTYSPPNGLRRSCVNRCPRRKSHPWSVASHQTSLRLMPAGPTSSAEFWGTVCRRKCRELSSRAPTDAGRVFSRVFNVTHPGIWSAYPTGSNSSHGLQLCFGQQRWMLRPDQGNYIFLYHYFLRACAPCQVNPCIPGRAQTPPNCDPSLSLMLD